MKNLLFLLGPNSIGKTSISKEIVRQLPSTAYVDSDPCRFMNPFVLSDETIPTIAKNISDLILNYMNCPVINNIVFSYGFHGRRKEVYERVETELAKTDYNFIPFLLWCSEEENIRRMNKDNRNHERVQRTLNESRKSFDDIIYYKIDITGFSIVEAAKKIIIEAGL
jgi:hypothetical protein